MSFILNKLIFFFTLYGCSSAQKPISQDTELLPLWVRSSNDARIIICNADDLDPQRAQELAENRCLSSAAKSQGVNIKLQSKTVDSLSGADSGETAEIEPLNSKVQCDYVNRYLEKVGHSFRVWLKCRIKTIESNVISSQNKTTLSETADLHSLKYKRGTLVLATTPKAEVIIVNGKRGERAIRIQKNVEKIELKEGDETIEVKRQGYTPLTINIGHWEHGDSISKSMTLTREL